MPLRILPVSALVIGLMSNAHSLAKENVSIHFWYGDIQVFGAPAHTQRWVNALGHASPAGQIQTLRFAVNDGAFHSLSFLEDRKRIAVDGDFNVEIDRATLRDGENRVRVIATDQQGIETTREMVIQFRQPTKGWPLPYTINWSAVDQIQDVAQVVDGKWKLTSAGIRSVEPYYDRIITFGDESWKDYEVTTSVTVHAVTGPRELPNVTGVTHAAIALRWPGHDQDGKQPSVKWFPLGATAEFRLGKRLQQCRWRIFDGKRKLYVESKNRRTIEFEKCYAMKHRVETMPDGRSRYRVKLWPAVESEPENWDLERFESDDLASGSACLIAHHSDVTFGNVSVVPIQ